MLIDVAAVRLALAAWYADHGRALVFRADRSPWRVLVSEVMLQQTQVSRVEPALAAFLARFPTPAALAAAATADVLRAWAGLGYNRRAVNLHRAALRIVERHGGEVPDTLDELRALPGVGPYTARAVAAIAFGLPAGAVDTNVRRVLGRLAAIDPPREQLVQKLADDLVDPVDPAAWTHAIMDLGATICRPRSPRCDACPLSPVCQAPRSIATRSPKPPTAGTSTASAFPSTSRWLRGRLVALLRETPDGEWVLPPARLGPHGAPAIAAAVVALHRDGLLERAEDGSIRLPR